MMFFGQVFPYPALAFWEDWQEEIEKNFILRHGLPQEMKSHNPTQNSKAPIPQLGAKAHE